MIKEYNHIEAESKWQQKWNDQQLFQASFSSRNLSKKKNYLLFAFPYPSGEGLHVGHVESKTALDILARYYRMMGEDVFFPVGWDAFGLPAENYAIKTGIPPAETTKKAIKTFSKQIKNTGISYDWQTEIATCHPGYYKWTQWLFLELYKAGMAYKGYARVNWCPSCNTVLANEQVVDGACERCGTQVFQKDLDQWFFKITDYKDELISGLDQVDWPEYTKQKQINWIGRSEGAEIEFKIDGTDDSFKVYTTAHDTIYGVTFMVLAPEHPILQKLQGQTLAEGTYLNEGAILKYVEDTTKKSEEDRIINREKTGVFTGLYAVNPVNGKKIPIWIADYVLMGYGTGAIMAVPGHDERDYDFATKHSLDVIYLAEDHDFISYSGKIKTDPTIYLMKNSDEFNGIDFASGRIKILEKLKSQGVAEPKVQYKLRDWLISRQRYWGPPIPIVYDPDGVAHQVKEEHLPWMLPTDVDFLPTGESPLKLSKEFKDRVERLYGKGWTPDYDTQDTFVDSCWYYLRYPDPRNESEFAQKSQIESWLPVDFYMIGPEHTVLHLLYSRFVTKFLRDRGYLNFDEPFLKVRHQGMILGPDNKKMSKSKGNIITPDSVISEYGADTLRVYEMFMGPIDADKPWDTNGVAGIKRFLNRIWNLTSNPEKSLAGQSSSNIMPVLHKTIKKVSTDIKDLKYNTAIAKMMEFINEWEKPDSKMAKEDTSKFVRLLAPFAPFISEEMWEQLQIDKQSVHLQTWPEYDEEFVKESAVTIVIQVNGKVRGNLENTKIDEDRTIVEENAKKAVQKNLENVEIVKTVYVPNRLINFVVKG